MKSLLFIVSILFSTSCIAQTEKIKSSIKTFYVEFKFTDSCGLIKIGSIGYSVISGIPCDSAVISKICSVKNLRKASIRYVSTTEICKADFDRIFKK